MNAAKIIFMMASLVVLPACRPTEPQIHSRVETVMGTLVEIRIVAGDHPSQSVDRALDAAFQAVRQTDALMSNYKDDSEVSQVNLHAAAEPVTVSRDTAEAISTALDISRKSNGAFDITVLPVLEIWGFAKERERTVPSQEQIAEKLQLVGYDMVELDRAKRTVRFRTEGMKMDLSAVAKGYAADSAIQSLIAHGIESAIINAGGDVYCLGRKKPTQRWRVGVRNPTIVNELLGYLKLENKAVATSGDYLNYFVADGARYAHIMDPRTGRPCEHGPHSVTVVADSCAYADALATAVFVLGRKEGLKLLETVPEAEGFIVSGNVDGLNTVCTEGWNPATRWQQDKHALTD